MSKPRMVRADDLVMVAEIAERFDVHKSTIGNWMNRYPDFPAPVAVLSAGAVYLMSEVLAWVEKSWPGRFTHGREW